MSLQAVGSAARDRLGAVVVKRTELAPAPIRFYEGYMLLVVVLGLVAWWVGVKIVAVGIVCLVLEALLAGFYGFELVRRAVRRGALTVHEQGVVISRKGSDEIIPYSQVLDFSLKEQEKLDDGKHAGVLRTLDFMWTGGRRRVVQFAGANVEDSFGPVLAELLGRLADEMQARLRSGVALEGKGWKLDSYGLHVDGQEPVRLKNLAGVAKFESKVSFWRAGQEQPFLSIPEASPNARLLSMLTQRQCSECERPQAGPLGRLLFQKKVGPVGKVFCWIGVGFCCLIGTQAIIHMPKDWSLVFVGSLGGALACAFKVINRFRVYELGVTSRTLLGERSLRYSEIISFQFGATRDYHNSVYTGTSVKMGFSPGAGGKELRHRMTIRGNDADLDMLREQVASMVARQLLELWKGGATIHWGPSARFARDGLVVRNDMFSTGEERLIPYGTELRLRIDEGVLYLFIGNETKAAMICSCAEHNFYPGLKMLAVLFPGSKTLPRQGVASSS